MRIPLALRRPTTTAVVAAVTFCTSLYFALMGALVLCGALGLRVDERKM
jgi:hypothetical protein